MLALLVFDFFFSFWLYSQFFFNMASCNQSFFWRIKKERKKEKRNLEVTEFLLLYYASQT
jgi:hypothetical protein